MTERDLQDLAREAEAGYDLSHAKRRPVGRPSLSEGTSPRVQFRIEPEVYRRAKQKAAAESRSLSDVGRELFTKYVGPASRQRPRKPKQRRHTH